MVEATEHRVRKRNERPAAEDKGNSAAFHDRHEMLLRAMRRRTRAGPPPVAALTGFAQRAAYPRPRSAT
ncbi:hypothetical protein [Sorangium sp. So ce385]|uniref:hypothetical protein n=1 Tax=Sorangium sp. So ce385 TaxID=3133308 RepID=UPI003F5B4F96